MKQSVTQIVDFFKKHKESRWTEAAAQRLMIGALRETPPDAGAAADFAVAWLGACYSVETCTIQRRYHLAQRTGPTTRSSGTCIRSALSAPRQRYTVNSRWCIGSTI